MRRFLFLIVIVIELAGGLEAAQVPSPGWERRLQNTLAEFLSCKERTDDSSPCNCFVGRALAEVCEIDDFEIPGKKDQYISANLIEVYVVTSPHWVLIGTAEKQKSLDEATVAANAGRAVIAVRPGERHGHVAMVLPGIQSFSPSWNLRVPNSASFFLGKPGQSYVGGGLSKAFTSPEGVKLFAYVMNSPKNLRVLP